MPLEAVKELWVPLCHDERRDVYEQTNRDHVKRVKPYSESRCDCAVEKRYGARYTSHEYLFCQCPVYGYLVTFHGHPSKPASAAESEEGEAEGACRKRYR